MPEGIRCRIKFYFLLSLFFMPVGMGEWRSRVIASCDQPMATEPDPGLVAIIREEEEVESKEQAAAATAASAAAEAVPVNSADHFANLDRGGDDDASGEQ